MLIIIPASSIVLYLCFQSVLRYWKQNVGLDKLIHKGRKRFSMRRGSKLSHHPGSQRNELLSSLKKHTSCRLLIYKRVLLQAFGYKQTEFLEMWLLTNICSSISHHIFVTIQFGKGCVLLFFKKAGTLFLKVKEFLP